MNEFQSDVDDFVSIVGTDNVLTSDIGPHIVDWTGRFVGNGRIVVRPGSTTEVAAIVDVCRARGRAIVPQGGNTGLVGGSVPLAGEVVLSTRRLVEMSEVDPSTRQITVGAGVTIGSIQRAAAEVGLRYGVDFAARDSATVGGTIATNAGGISVLRFGMTRRHVVGVEAVLANGDTISHLRGLVKDNTGYDLIGLMCGSEGSLGIVTAARVQLVRLHAHRTTAFVGFESVKHAVDAVAALCAQMDDIDAIELVLRNGVDLVCKAFGRSAPFDARAYLLIETSADQSNDERLAGIVADRSGVEGVAIATSPASRQRLWQLREDHTAAINTLGPPVKFDVSVPMGAIPTFIDSVTRALAVRFSNCGVFVFGHAADGNLHINVTSPDADSATVVELEDLVMTIVMSHGGSVSAEHGIGTHKKRFLEMSRSPEEVRTMKAIKRALDPQGIMNPQVLFT